MKQDMKTAHAWYRRGRYARVIRLLEPLIFKYRESFTFYYLLGMSCLRTGDTGGARTYLDRSLSLKPNDSKALAGLAVVHLKRYEITRALQCYLDIVDNEPQNRLARKGLRLLRRNADRDRLTPIIDSGRVEKLLPRDRRRSGLAVSAVMLLLFAAAGSAYYLYRDRFIPVLREPTVAALSIEDLLLTASTSNNPHTLTEREIERAFADAKRYFAEFRDNLALREINRLLRSNASETVKTQARTISSFIPEPDFTTITDPFPFATVVSDPTLYEGAFAVWRGRTSNLRVGEDSIRFDLLVGYDTNEVLEGVVPVVVDFAIELANGRPVEVLGKITVAEPDIGLRAVSIHKLADG
jgi:hypothetical protein